jgi:hypothetical protein
MKIATKFALAAAFAIAAAAPAFAANTVGESGDDVQVDTPRPVPTPCAHRPSHVNHRDRATDARAYEPEPATGPDFSILSQH